MSLNPMDTVAVPKLRRRYRPPGLPGSIFEARRPTKIRAHARVDKSAKSALLKSAARMSIAGSSPAPGIGDRGPGHGPAGNRN